MKTRFRIQLFTWLMLLSYLGTGQQYRFKHFSVEEGLPQSQVYAMVEDSRGLLWLGTKGGGVSKFDGKHFTSYTKEDGLIADQVYALFEDSEHNIWIGTHEGISVFNGIKFVNHEVVDGGLVISGIIEDEKNQIWISSNVGIYYLDKRKNKWINYSNDHGILSQTVSCLYKDEDNSIWAGNGQFSFLG